ncbi:hypothetical protein FZEAL_2731 [Fusarium zealandicum]|uniref:AAA+ ATPase domain-containing protein n=1 Tax=Fusarium zealandicum TaxID=1053134 RepID=A0A8H4UQ86_9HYPO|nr:hypothetical protein FZEAL_2731 [Fusarium zealandicum]
MVQEGMREPDAKKVHPFFSKGPAFDPLDPLDPSEPPASCSAAPPDTDILNDNHTSASESIGSRRKRRKTETALPLDAPGPKKPRRKRQSELVPHRDTTNITSTNVEQYPETTTVDHVTAKFPTPPLSDAPVNPTNIPLPMPNVHTDATANTTKVLKWNPKTGTLGSPPKSKSKNRTSRIVCIRYGQDEANRKEVGDKISQILEGKTLFHPSPPKGRGRKSKAAASKQGTGASNATHPFFTGKVKQANISGGTNQSILTERSPAPRHTIFMSTPMSPKKTRNPFTSDHQVPRFGVKTGATKIPGAMQPLWPAKGMAHVRGFDVPFCAGTPSQEEAPKKSKGCTVTVTPSESVLGGFCTCMDLTALRNSLPRDDNNFVPAPTELRIPTTHFESGRKLQQRIKPELRTLRLAATEEGDATIDDDGSDTQFKRSHSAILRLYEGLETSLSAYDKSTCESLSWTHKYAPVSASEVLQAGKEAVLLKEWLQTLKVQSVSTGSLEAGGSKAKSKADTAPKKRRKKDKLDGFIVDSEEEANDMDEVSENEDDWAPAGSGLLKKTVIRTGDNTAKGGKAQGRFTNAVVISGPHGSGKTAAVYAVAKELGFEIFEINPGSRRSGKDILEKVGDMTRNHLVQQHRADPAAETTEEDEVTRDLATGKQGMMTAFFQPKTTSAPKKPTKKPAEEKLIEAPKAAKNQKQSLILLEEVDVLYEEDKQFWTTLMGMIAQSKRPFIMTCNDENLVPLQSLNLHGILRFSPPPCNLAVDLCLLVAANEGHLLRRTAVEALYKSRNNDLRGALVELNYWCQIGVGDRKGGFDWFYLRWPKGSDLDENGDVVRVLSQDTYCKGMGWYGRDLIATCPDPLEAEEEVMKQSWDSWTLDSGNWNDILDVQTWAGSISATALNSGRRLDVLAALDNFCTSMSDADMISSGSLGISFQEVLAPEMPEMSAKARDDFIVGRRLLEADPQVSPSSPSVSLSISLKSLSRQALFKAPLTLDNSPVSTLRPLTENRAVSILDQSFQQSTTSLTRMDLALAFDPIAVNEKTAVSSHLDPSVFDRTTKLIVSDVAPWVRGIVEFDNKLMQERMKLGNLLSEGGQGGKRKRMRTTRSAYSAMEGGERKTTRRERYFGDCLNTAFVRRTAGEAWSDAVIDVVGPKESTASIPSSPSSSQDSNVV